MPQWKQTKDELPKAAGCYQIFPDPMRDARVSVAEYVPATGLWTDLRYNLPASPTHWSELNEIP